MMFAGLSLNRREAKPKQNKTQTPKETGKVERPLKSVCYFYLRQPSGGCFGLHFALFNRAYVTWCGGPEAADLKEVVIVPRILVEEDIGQI